MRSLLIIITRCLLSFLYITITIISSVHAAEIQGRRLADIVISVVPEKETLKKKSPDNLEEALERIAQRLLPKLKAKDFYSNSNIPISSWGGAFLYGHPKVTLELPRPIMEFVVTDKKAQKGRWVSAGSEKRSVPVNSIRIRFMYGSSLDSYLQDESLKSKAEKYKKDGDHYGYSIGFVEEAGGKLARISYPMNLTSSLKKKTYAGISGEMFSVRHTGKGIIDVASWKDNHYPFKIPDKRHDKGKGLPALFRGSYSPITQKVVDVDYIKSMDTFFEYKKDNNSPPIGIRVTTKDMAVPIQEILVPDEAMIDYIMETIGRLVLEEFEGKRFAEASSPEQQEEPESQKQLEVIAHGGDMNGQALFNGDVLQHQFDFERPEKLELTINGVPEKKKDAVQLYEAKVLLKKRHRNIVSVKALNGARVRKIPGGYKITGKKSTIDLALEYNRNGLKQVTSTKGPLLIIPVMIKAGTEKVFFYDQVVPDWDIIITRFMVKGKGSEGLRKLLAAQAGPRKIEDYRFNSYARKLGKTWDDWNGTKDVKGLKDSVKTMEQGDDSRQVFGLQEEVVLGWSRDESGQKFIKAINKTGDDLDKIPFHIAQDELLVELGIEIYQAPKVVGPDPQADTTVVEDPGETEEDPDFMGDDTDFFYTNEEEVSIDKMRRMWEPMRVEEFSLTLHKVNTNSFDLRARASKEIFKGNYSHQRTPNRTKLKDYFPLTGMNIYKGQLETEGFTNGYKLFPIREPGVYELRLQLKVGLLDQSRQVDAAIRFIAVMAGYDIKSSYQNMKRKR